MTLESCNTARVTKRQLIPGSWTGNGWNALDT